MEGLVFIIWIAVIASMISSVKKKNAQNSQRSAPSQSGAQERGNVSKAEAAYRAYAAGGRAQTPVSAFENTSGSRRSERAVSIRDNGLLMEDRQNDWLARQMREEAAILRRGSLYDLGAAHDANCDAKEIKLFHVRHHNSNGLDRDTFKH